MQKEPISKITNEKKDKASIKTNSLDNIHYCIIFEQNDIFSTQKLFPFL